MFLRGRLEATGIGASIRLCFPPANLDEARIGGVAARDGVKTVFEAAFDLEEEREAETRALLVKGLAMVAAAESGDIFIFESGTNFGSLSPDLVVEIGSASTGIVFAIASRIEDLTAGGEGAVVAGRFDERVAGVNFIVKTDFEAAVNFEVSVVPRLVGALATAGTF
jgi:hypothetical protein